MLLPLLVLKDRGESEEDGVARAAAAAQSTVVVEETC